MPGGEKTQQKGPAMRHLAGEGLQPFPWVYSANQVVRALRGRSEREDMLVQALRDQTIALGVLYKL